MPINAITTKTVKSKTVLDCKTAINSYSEHDKIRIIWVPGHHGVRGNERANDLATKARELQEINLENAKPFGATRSELITWARHAHFCSKNVNFLTPKKSHIFVMINNFLLINHLLVRYRVYLQGMLSAVFDSNF